MENIFTESDQSVVFPANWWVIALDKHRYYQRVSGQGLKAVDFLAIDDDFGLVMIELKNYRGEPVPADLSATLEQKCLDTERLIRIVNKYLDRKLYYRIFYKWLHWHYVCDREWVFWERAADCIRQHRVLRLCDIQE